MSVTTRGELVGTVIGAAVVVAVVIMTVIMSPNETVFLCEATHCLLLFKLEDPWI